MPGVLPHRFISSPIIFYIALILYYLPKGWVYQLKNNNIDVHNAVLPPSIRGKAQSFERAICEVLTTIERNDGTHLHARTV